LLRKKAKHFRGPLFLLHPVLEIVFVLILQPVSTGSVGGRGMLLLAVGTELRRYSLEEKRTEYSNVVVTDGRIQSLAVDSEHRLVYWTDTSAKAIRRATVPMDDRHQAIVQTLRTGRTLVAPNGIALDWVAKYASS